MEKDHKQSLLLPRTSFPIRNREGTQGQTIVFWEEKGVYHRSLALNTEGEKFILHDGPPYANGSIHVGHLVNRILKDFVVRFHNLLGYQTFFKLGWDSHGLPIEFRVISAKNEVPRGQIREACREYAGAQIEVQRQQLRELGLLTDYKSNYSTSDNSYEAEQLYILAQIVEKKLIYRGWRPIYWSTSHQTALAENEVEYQNREDFSLFFKLELTKPFLAREHVKLLIWTTQPWTIPGNMFIGVKPSSDYSLVTSAGELLVCASEYVEKITSRELAVLQTFKGSELLALEYLAPYPGLGPFLVIDAENLVRSEEGTGILHLAPACGAEDFLLAQREGVAVTTLIDEKGDFLQGNPVSQLVGVFYQKANRWIIDDLTNRGLVDSWGKFTHSYPHDWRDKTPLVYRLTSQWFIDLRKIQQSLLANIERVEWVPAHSKEKMLSFIKNRDDWCISRQRKWGVPLPVVYRDGETILNADVIKYTAGLVAKEGSDFWFQGRGLELVREKFASKFGGGLRIGSDTLDVWFDSGVSSFCVLEKEGNWPADVYLEGSDQFRGWFNASLIISTIVRGLPPYRKVISHGFTVDKNGRKMSKSLGNTVDPLALIGKFGTDTLRLWVASVDFTKEIKISNEILLSVQDNYQKLRNCLRFIIASLYLEKDAKDSERLFSASHGTVDHLNAYIRAYLLVLSGETRSSYLESNFVNVYNLVNNFCVNKLSGFYFEVIKDILYCDPQYSRRRQAILETLNEILKKMLVLVVALVPFLAEEVYQAILSEKETFAFKNDSFYSHESINFIRSKGEHLKETQVAEKVGNFESSVLLLRKDVFRELEKARQEKLIETNQQAVVTLFIPKDDHYSYFSSLFGIGTEKDLSLLFIVAEVNIETAEQFSIRIEKTSCLKCERCWRFIVHPDNKQLLCLRCAQTLS